MGGSKFLNDLADALRGTQPDSCVPEPGAPTPRPIRITLKPEHLAKLQAGEPVGFHVGPQQIELVVK